MKKLAIALAVVALAAASQAASVKWSYAATTAERGNMVYIILGDTVPTSFENAQAVINAGKSSAEIVKVGKSGSAASGTITDSSLTASTAMYAVMVSADQKQWAATTAFTPGADYVQGEQDSEKGAYGVPAFGAMKNFSGGAEPVPEPTSGLLVLLGIAGLALRRRCA